MKALLVFGVFIILIYEGITQTAYPQIRSGTASFTANSGSSYFNVTYINPFDAALTLHWVHSINGLSFQSANMTSSAQFNFYTQIAAIGHYSISLYSLFSDNYLIQLKVSYMVFGNQQLLTWVVFLVLDVINGTTSGSISDDTQFGPRHGTFTSIYSLGGFFMEQNSTAIIAYPCLQALQIGTSQILNFLLDSSYSATTSTLTTNVFVYFGTYIRSIKLQAIMFNNIQVKTENYYHTYFAGYNYFPGSPANIETTVREHDVSYFFTFQAFYGVKIDLINVLILINGSSVKYFSVNYTNENTLRFTTNFMQNMTYFSGAFVYAYYLAFTKYKSSNLSGADSSSSTTVIVIAAVVSIVVISASSILIYKKCEISKRLKRKSFELKNWQNIRFQA